MTLVTIPEWTPQGVLPPLDARNPTGSARSPYAVSLMELVRRFSNTSARRRILSGLLGYRGVLHHLGLVAGMQWIDGSFTEWIETLEQRAPNDMDVVSFVLTPEGFSPRSVDLEALDHQTAKARFHIDGYLVGMNELPPQSLVAQSAYWYAVWSHRRDHQWKGFLQLDLAPHEDALASDWLARYDVENPRP